MAKERIDKILSHQGFGSRKDVKKLLRSSEVLVNGQRIFDSASQLDPEKDLLTVDGEEISLMANRYIMMNKIMHTISANKDGLHQTVFDLLSPDLRTPYLEEKLHLVGRLDMDTEGLLLFTTDGELTHRLISPKSHICKTYFCVLEHPESDEHKEEIERLFKKGIEVGPEDNEAGFKCEPAEIKWASEEEYTLHTKKSSVLETLEKTGLLDEGKKLSKNDSPAETVSPTKNQNNQFPLNPQNQVALLTIYEGKYHQVKRMFAAVGNKVIFLKRISMGGLNLDNELEPGKYREVSEEELELLR
ncbi:MAG: rRNA pseudouridine synthase [Treponema sp.]|nr:rRNA pseudouridine synthase [Treponema sp.]